MPDVNYLLFMVETTVESKTLTKQFKVKICLNHYCTYLFSNMSSEGAWTRNYILCYKEQSLKLAFMYIQ